MIQKKQSKNISRRHFGKMIAGSILALGGTGVYLLTRGEPYSAFYHREIASRKGARLVRTEFLKEKNPIGEERKTLIDQLVKKTGKRPVIAREQFFEGNLFNEWSVSSGFFEEYALRSKKHIAQFFDFVDLSSALPHIEFHLLGKKGEIKRSDENIHFYVAHEVFDSPLIGNYELNSLGSGKYLLLSLEENLGGGFSLEVGAHLDKNRISLNASSTPIVLSAGIHPVKSYNSPPAETLHYVLCKSTLKGIEEEVNKIWEKKEEPRKLEIEWLNPIIQEGFQREEGIVHAALNQFVRKNRRAIGVSSKELERMLDTYKSDTRYRYVPSLEKQMEREGGNKIVRKYFANHKSIIFN